jgi:hypothetical protein
VNGPRRRHRCACHRFVDFDCGETIPDTANWAPGHDVLMLDRLVTLLRAGGDIPSVAVRVNPITAAELVSARLAAQLRTEYATGARAAARLDADIAEATG